jgi:hypothetical protein
MDVEMAGSRVPEVSDERPINLNQLGTRLRRAQLRIRWGLAIRSLAAGALAGTATLAVLESLRRLFPGGYAQTVSALFGPDVLSRPLLVDALCAGVAAAIAAVVSGVVSLRLVPSTHALARAADRLFDFSERVSTALELQAPALAGVGGPFRQPLFADAAARASALEPRCLAPLPVPRAALAAVALFLATAILQFYAGPPLLKPDPTVTAPSALLSDAEQAEMATRLAGLADQFADAGEAAHNDYLRAVGRTLTDLARSVGASPVVDRDDLISQLASLLAQAQANAADAAGSAATGIDQLAEAVRSLGSGSANSGPDASATDELAADQPPPMSQLQTPEGGTADPNRDDGAGAAGDAPATADAGGPGPPVESDTTLPAGAMPLPASLTPPYNPADEEGQFFDPPDPSTRPKSIVGASSQASHGAGDLAGVGSTPLANQTDWSALTIAQDGALHLDQPADGSGRRIQIAAAPATAASTSSSPTVIPGGWQPADEASVAHTAIGPAWRDLVARYFTPSSGDGQ